MIWLTLRQHRAQIATMLITAALLVIGLAVIGSYAADQRAALGVDTCTPLPNTNLNCFELEDEWRRRLGPASFLALGLFVVPALFGSFFGGPLFAGDLESGTHRLVLTQALSRARWSASKLVLMLGIGAGAALLLGQFGWAAAAVMGGAWRSPYDIFDVEGPTIVAYALFALAVAALIGVWSRRILTGMFAGLLAFALVRAAVATGLRPNYEPALVSLQNAYSDPTTVPGDVWILRSEIVDAQGRLVSNAEIDRLMRGFHPVVPEGNSPDMGSYLASLGVRARITYQPTDRYVRFQWTEAALFSGLALVCGLGTIALIRRRDA